MSYLDRLICKNSGRPYEIVVTTVPQANFGIAFTEASGPCLIRTEGNDNGLIDACVKNLQALGAGHVFCILMRGSLSYKCPQPD